LIVSAVLLKPDFFGGGGLGKIYFYMGLVVSVAWGLLKAYQAVYLYLVYGPLRPSWGLRQTFMVALIRGILQRLYWSFNTTDLRPFTMVPSPLEPGSKLAKIFQVPRRHDLVTDGLKSKERSDPIYAELIVPKKQHNEKKVVLYIHGGGFVFGSAKQIRRLTSKLAVHSGIPVFSIDYSLSPEYGYPTALHDCLACYFYLIDKLGYEPKNIAIGGESAGGMLSLSVLVWLREHGFSQPNCGVLLSPSTDHSASMPSRYLNLRYDYLPPGWMHKKYRALNWFSYYVQAHWEARLSPIVSHVLSKPTSIPLAPLLIQAGEVELLRDDSIVFCANYQRFAFQNNIKLNPIHCEIYEDAVHVFQEMTRFTEQADFAMKRIYQFLKENLSDDHIPPSPSVEAVSFVRVSRNLVPEKLSLQEASEIVDAGYFEIRNNPKIVATAPFDWKIAAKIWDIRQPNLQKSSTEEIKNDNIKQKGKL
jgi:monoterpene epsilon-lactone hydrolase